MCPVEVLLVEAALFVQLPQLSPGLKQLLGSCCQLDVLLQ
jgi:hypothetical protein